MQHRDLNKVLEWAYSQLQEGDHSLDDFYQYMKLIDALQAVKAILPPSLPVVILNNHRSRHLQSVDNYNTQDNFPAA